MKTKNIMTLIAGGLMLTACSSENVWDYDGSAAGGDGEYADVTFSVRPEASVLTRAGEDTGLEGGPGRWQTLSKGSKVDMLIYAVYDESYTLLSQYSQSIVDYTEGSMPDDFSTKFTVDADNHFGQTIMYVGDKLYTGTDVVISMRLMRGKVYHLALWAQSSETSAYKTDDLKKVEVDYTGALNNDETRDAFCKVETFTVGNNGLNQNIILTRPLAQINVGTSGADYKNLEKGVTTDPHRTVTYSKMSIKGVAKYINVVQDEILSGTNDLTDVDFGWAKIPAYYNVETIPTSDLYKADADKEELLTIDLNQDGEILDYRTSYPTLGSAGSYMTEKFKYLSMAYVLVPTPSDIRDDEDGYSFVLNNVTIDFADDANGTNPLGTLTVNQIPSRRNWRTNILGGMRWMQDPTDPSDSFTDPDDPNDPDDPDYTPTTPPAGPDPSTLFNTVYVQPTIVSDFFGDKDIIKVEDYLQVEE